MQLGTHVCEYTGEVHSFCYLALAQFKHTHVWCLYVERGTASDKVIAGRCELHMIQSHSIQSS